jgi:hypothetical protein
MISRLLAVVAITLLLAGTSSDAQVAPPECSPPAQPNAIRLALLIADPNDLPFSGIGRVSVLSPAQGRPAAEDETPRFLQAWYCSDELPQGRYTVEVRMLNFDCTAISISESETGLIVRLIRLRPDRWRASERGQRRFVAAFDPHMSLVERLGSRKCDVATG